MALRDSIIRLAIAFLLAVNIYFAATEPCTSAEAAVYQRYASRPILTYWSQPFDPRLGLVYGALARLTTRFAGVSELTLRIPGILGGLLFCLSLAQVLPGWWGLLVFGAVAANPWTFRAFSTASGGSLAAGLFAAAIYQSRRRVTLAGVLIASAIGADAAIAALALPFMIAVSFVRKMSFWRWIDELVIPTVVLTLFACPVLSSREKALPAASNDTGTRQTLQTFMREERNGSPVLLGVSRSLEPGAFFYRRRYHLDWITIRAVQPGNSFYLLAPSDEGLIATWRLHVIEKKPGAILAEK